MKTTSDDIISASWTDRLSDCNILFRLQSHPFTIQRRFIWGCCWMSVRKTNEEQGKGAFNLAAAAAAPPFSSHFPLCSSFYFISIFVCQTTRSSVFTICDALHTHTTRRSLCIYQLLWKDCLLYSFTKRKQTHCWMRKTFWDEQQIYWHSLLKQYWQIPARSRSWLLWQ